LQEWGVLFYYLLYISIATREMKDNPDWYLMPVLQDIVRCTEGFNFPLFNLKLSYVRLNKHKSLTRNGH
jgi:hypothetical protein